MSASSIVKPTHLTALTIAEDREVAFSVGGQIKKATAAAALYIGDAVYITSAGKVNKSGTAATVGVPFMGVVVGGESLDADARISFETLVLASPITAASGDGKAVYVQVDGIVQVRTDTTVDEGDALIGGTTAGRVTPGTTQGAMLGIAVSPCTGAGIAKMLIRPR